ncbi:MAG: RecX family transcriptional regulator [Magnetococcales bacterium]|nr:RecX family transcriptional regulator [Magnetococcales bacterium]
MGDSTRKEDDANAHDRDYRGVYDRAIRILALRDHGVEELRRKLLAKGEPSALVERVLEACLGSGLLNDPLFAYRRAVSRMAGKGYGPLKVRGELLVLGLTPEVVSEGMAKALEEIDLGDIVARVFERRCAEFWKGGAAGADQRAKRRCFDLLFRRGFDTDTIHRVLSRSPAGVTYDGK